MENTGRIGRTLSPALRRILFEGRAGEEIESELRHATEIDRAHLVMLAERGLVDGGRAALLLAAIDGLRGSGFAPLRERSAPRGLYLLYEDHLIETLGAEVGGILQTARSRNDLNATLVLLRLRGVYLRLTGEVLRLQALLLCRAERTAEVVMPVYTHYQPALPITYGHYLAGVAEALRRDLEALLALHPALDVCPLGAGAAGGTTLPIDPARTARLLGFAAPVEHSLDAVASRDLVLRFLAAAGVLGVLLSRVASDLLLWSTQEVAFVEFPDHLVGSSSMMPQKRNPFPLEHVQGRSAAPLGALVHAAAAMHGTPFSNSIAVGTEALAPAWDALAKTREAVVLLRAMIAGAQPRPAAMEEAARRGHTVATELANRLVAEAGLPFRRAHHLVGEIVTRAVESGEPLESAAAERLAREDLAVGLEGLDPAAVARASEHGGGPGPGSVWRHLARLQEHWSAATRQVREQAAAWRRAGSELDAAAESLRAAAPASGKGAGSPE